MSRSPRLPTPLFHLDVAEVLAAALDDPRVADRVVALWRRAIREEEESKILLDDVAMAEKIGVHVRTFRRRYRDCPELLALATLPGERAERWPTGPVMAWWKLNK
jgi:hypothetical protein